MDRRYLDIPDVLTGDQRLTPLRDGVAGRSLLDAVDAERFEEGQNFYVTGPVCVLRSDAAEDAPVDTQLLHGEDFVVYGEKGDWFWGQSDRDHYVGWVRKGHLSEGSIEASHYVLSRGTFLYRNADLKSQALMKIPMASQLNVQDEVKERGVTYLKTDFGWVVGKHVCPHGKTASDFVKVGESLIGTAYLWAGRSTFGVDCSGFIQLCMQMAGIAVLRDTYMQEATIGEEVEFEPDFSGLMRGDLVFWPGHVGIMRDEKTLLHANGHTMTVYSEPLEKAVDRIAYLYDQPHAIRRPFALSG